LHCCEVGAATIKKGERAVKVKVGSAPDSWGVWFPNDPRQTPWERFLDEISAAGYEWTELGPYGYLPSDSKTLRPELERRGLKVTGSFVMGDLANPATSWPEIERQLRGWGPILKDLAAGFLVLIDDTYTDLFSGEARSAPRLDDPGFRRLVDTTRRIAEIARTDYGLQLVFHPHAQTHVEYEDQIEALLDASEPDLVSLLLDTGHHAYCDGDPVSFMRRHHRRIPYLHLKNIDSELRAKVAAENIPFAQAVALEVFVEPANGAVDFLAFRDVLRDLDFVGFGIVEQDMFPAPFDKPLAIAKRTRAYLREIGLG
jgi:inosose dehydratase